MASMLSTIRRAVTRRPAPRRESLVEVERALRSATCFTVSVGDKSVTLFDRQAAERFSNVLADLSSGAHGQQWW